MKALSLNLRHLATRDLTLTGEVPADELELNNLDDLIRVCEPVRYELEVQKLEDDLLVQGKIMVRLECQCVRCLKTFSKDVKLEPFVAQVILEGEDAVPVEGDFVDLTPQVREDIVLAFPQHPLCEPGCVGLRRPAAPATEAQAGQASQTTSPAWAVLNDLKL